MLWSNPSDGYLVEWQVGNCATHRVVRLKEIFSPLFPSERISMATFTQNPFALLGDDELPAAAAAPAVVAKKDTTVVKKAAAPATTATAGKQQDRPPRNEYARRGGFRGSAGAVGTTTEGMSVDVTYQCVTMLFPCDVVARVEEKDAAREDQHRRHAHRPRRGQRGGWSGHGRQMDRHSGLPRDSEKKVTQGWGQASEEDGTVANAAAVPVEGVEGEASSPVPVEEPEEVVKTLDDYLAEKAAQKLQIALPAPRKANEGTDGSKWKNTAPLERVDDDVFYAGDDKKKAQKEKIAAAALKQHVAITMKFNDEPKFASRGERGGRGGDRGGRGGSRGSNRGSRSYAPNVNDSKAFPILTK